MTEQFRMDKNSPTQWHKDASVGQYQVSTHHDSDDVFL